MVNLTEHCLRLAWVAFKLVATKVLGNDRADNYMKLVSSLVDAYTCMGYNLSLELHFLDSQLDFLSPNCGEVNSECKSAFIKTYLRRKRGTKKIEPINSYSLLLDDN